MPQAQLKTLSKLQVIDRPLSQCCLKLQLPSTPFQGTDTTKSPQGHDPPYCIKLCYHRWNLLNCQAYTNRNMSEPKEHFPTTHQTLTFRLSWRNLDIRSSLKMVVVCRGRSKCNDCFWSWAEILKRKVTSTFVTGLQPISGKKSLLQPL